MKRLSKSGLVLLAVCLACAFTLYADPIPFGTISGTSYVTTTQNVTVNGASRLAGLFDITYTNNTSGIDFLRDGAAAGTQFLAFCIEVEQTLANTEYTIVDLADGKTSVPNNPIGADRASALGSAFAAFFGTTGIDRSLDATAYAAMQIVIWEIVYEANPAKTGNWSYDLTAGSVNFVGTSQGILSLASGWINTINAANRPTLTNSELFALNSEGKQDLVVQAVNQGGEEVPEPATLALLGAALLVLGVSRRMRRTA